MFEAEAEAKASRPRPKFWPHFGLEDITSLIKTRLCLVLTVITDGGDTVWNDVTRLVCYRVNRSRNAW